MPLKEEVCRACHQKNAGGFTAADDDRWRNHSLVMCPAGFMYAGQQETDDKRTLRSTDDAPADWCPSKDKHKKADRRRYYGSGG